MPQDDDERRRQPFLLFCREDVCSVLWLNKNFYPLKRITNPLFFLFCYCLILAFTIPWLGLYGDDWPYLYSYHVAGAGGYAAFVAADRPFSAWIYVLFSSIFGEWVTGYHLLLLGLRWLAAWLFWRILLRLWPSRPRLAFVAAAILCIYPGFKQQAIPIEFILHFTVLCLFFLSLLCMMRAAQEKKWGWLWNIGGAVSALSMFSVEYFVGLEVLRPLFLWILLRDEFPDPKQRLKKLIRVWIPYLAVFAGFLYWRVFIFSFQFYQPELLGQLQENPLKALVLLAWSMADSLWKAVFQVWSISLSTKAGLPELAVHLAVVGAGFLIGFWFFYKTDRMDPQTAERHATPWQPLLIGLVALLAAGSPYWLTSIQIWLEFPWDRPLLSFIPGAAIVLAALLEILFRPRIWRYVIALLCASALLSNFINARSYIQRWQQVSSYLQQLTIRAPGLQPGTILLTQDIGRHFVYYGDSSLTPAINWMYAPQVRSNDLQYRIFDLSVRKDDLLTEIETEESLTNSYRTLAFEGNLNDLLTIYLNPEGCLRVLGPEDISPPNTPDWLSDLTVRSQLCLIDPSPVQPAQLPHIFSNFPENTWCTAFQRIDLARQMGDWEAAAALAQEAIDQGLTASDASEYLPVIEVLIKAGDWQLSEELVSRLTKDMAILPSLEILFQKMENDPNLDTKELDDLRQIISSQ